MKSKIIELLSYDTSLAWLNENYANKLANDLRPLLKKEVAMLNMALIKYYQSKDRNPEYFGHNLLIKKVLTLRPENSKPNPQQLQVIKVNLKSFLKCENDDIMDNVLKSYYAFNERGINKFVQLFDFYSSEMNDDSLTTISSKLIGSCYEKESSKKWDLKSQVVETMANAAALNVGKIKDFLES